MRRDARVLLTDIDQAGADIEIFTDGMDSAAFAVDARTLAAEERTFEIIGEAVNRLHKDHPELARRIPEMRGSSTCEIFWPMAMTMWRRDSSGFMHPAACRNSAMLCRRCLPNCNRRKNEPRLKKKSPEIPGRFSAFDFVTLDATFARQSNVADNPSSYDAPHFSVQGAFPLGGGTLTVGYDTMGSDVGRYAFRTPVAPSSILGLKF